MATNGGAQLSRSMSPNRFNRSMSSVGHEHSPHSPMPKKSTENKKVAECHTPQKNASDAMDRNMNTPEKRHPPDWEKICWAPKVCLDFYIFLYNVS